MFEQNKPHVAELAKSFLNFVPVPCAAKGLAVCNPNLLYFEHSPKCVRERLMPVALASAIIVFHCYCDRSNVGVNAARASLRA